MRKSTLARYFFRIEFWPMPIETQHLPIETNSLAALYEQGGLQLASGDVQGAIDLYFRCMTLDRHNPAIHNNLGSALIKAARFEEAVTALEAALLLQPGYVRALMNLGKALREIGKHHDSRGRLNEALQIQPDYAPALINLGDTLAAMSDFKSALPTLQRAVVLAPNQVESHLSLGIAQFQAGQISDSLLTLTTAVNLAPQHPEAHSNLAYALFASGDWRASWPHFEYRFKRFTRPVALKAPTGMLRWDGTVSEDLELWLIGEQGLGDQLQFSRYASVLATQNIQCTLACDPRLTRILSRLQPGPRSVVSHENLATAKPAYASNARWFPLMSVPAWLQTTPDTVPFARGYLASDPLQVARWSARLDTALRTPENIRVALSWAGNPHMETGRYAGRSPPFHALAPLMSVPGVDFISVQKGGEDALHRVNFSDTLLHLSDLDGGSDAFIDTAAVLKSVDLLITSDTAIAHLGGALGVPTWLCLMHEPDWRWMQKGDRTPWYTSKRLFRQSSRGNWAAVYAEIASELIAQTPLLKKHRE